MGHLFNAIGDAVDSFRLWLGAENAWLANVASIFAIVGIIFAAIYWWMLRRQELHQKRWEQHQLALSAVWAKGPTGGSVPSVLQIAAVYQLVEFREFSYITALSLEKAAVDNPADWKRDVGPHVANVVILLKRSRAYKSQSKQFAIK